MAEEFIKTEVNCATGEVVELPMTEAEIADILELRAKAEERAAAEEAEMAAKAEAKTSALSKLAALGLTEEEAQAIVGN